jgi:DNA-binding MarR family transcriptional regulator
MFADKEINNKILIALRRIMRAVDLHSKNLERNFNLTGPQLILLREIDKIGDTPIGILAQHINLSNATMTGIVDRLEKRQLVERVRNANDRRQVIVRVTDRGKAMVSESPPLLQDRFIEELAKLAKERQTTILDSLEQVAAMMHASHLDVAPMLSVQPIADTNKLIDREDNNK